MLHNIKSLSTQLGIGLVKLLKQLPSQQVWFLVIGCEQLHMSDCIAIRISKARREPYQYSTEQYSTVQYSTVQYSTVQYSILCEDPVTPNGNMTTYTIIKSSFPIHKIKWISTVTYMQ